MSLVVEIGDECHRRQKVIGGGDNVTSGLDGMS